jgi:hypothetical protein
MSRCICRSRTLGGLLTPSPPAEKATARQEQAGHHPRNVSLFLENLARHREMRSAGLAVDDIAAARLVYEAARLAPEREGAVT